MRTDSYACGYDNANRVTTEVNAEGTVTYAYDSGGELLSANGSRTESYSYDSGGNRNSSGYTTGTGNEMTASPGYTYTYDGEGNMIGETQTSTGDVWTFGYDNRNRLVSAVEKSSGGTVLAQATYTYNALNQRIGVKDNGTQTWTVFDGTSADANSYADFNGSGTLLTRYMSTQAIDEILARTSASGVTAWYLTDRLGSVRDIVNTSGTVIDHVVYDSYGNILSETSPTNGDRFKFTGMEWDAAIGQYYDHARDYDAAAGRFMSQDPSWFTAGDMNLYRYVGNGVTDSTDTNGLQDGAPAVSDPQPTTPTTKPEPTKPQDPPTPRPKPVTEPTHSRNTAPVTPETNQYWLQEHDQYRRAARHPGWEMHPYKDEINRALDFRERQEDLDYVEYLAKRSAYLKQYYTNMKEVNAIRKQSHK